MAIHDQFANHDVQASGGATFEAYASQAKNPAVAKRFMDLAIAVPALILCLPLMALVAIAITLDSAGPVLFSQKRLGQGGHAFLIYKFRTMRVLEDGVRVVQASKNDPRITRVGRFLRSSSLDELPQLINVLLGDMSMVGPRPHAIAHDMLYAALISEYTNRQRARPGITGWAQVNGARGPTPTTQDMRIRVLFDNWYVEHSSLTLDLKILLRTPLEVLRQRNAY